MQGRCGWVRLHEKGGKEYDPPLSPHQETIGGNRKGQEKRLTEAEDEKLEALAQSEFDQDPAKTTQLVRIIELLFGTGALENLTK